MTRDEIAEEQEKVFDELFTVDDIKKGNTVEMHQEARKIAINNLKEKDMNTQPVVVVAKYNENLELRVEVVDAPDGSMLDFFYENIDCTIVELVGFDDFDCWINEEGLYKNGNPVFEYDGVAQLAGNLVFTKTHDSEGETVVFDKEKDADLILKIMKFVSGAKLLGTIG